MLYVCRTIESEVRVYLRKQGVPMRLNNYWMGFTVIHVFFLYSFRLPCGFWLRNI